jgi:hypothetical protein
MQNSLTSSSLSGVYHCDPDNGTGFIVLVMVGKGRRVLEFLAWQKTSPGEAERGKLRNRMQATLNLHSSTLSYRSAIRDYIDLSQHSMNLFI